MNRLFYRLLLRLFPPDMRADYGGEMEELFCTTTVRQGLDRIRLWSSLVADAVRHGVGARFDRGPAHGSRRKVFMDLIYTMCATHCACFGSSPRSPR